MKSISNLILFLFIISENLFSQAIHHDLSASIFINESRIEIIDEITFPQECIMNNGELVFSLNANLEVYSPDKQIVIKEIEGKESKDARVTVKTYTIRGFETTGEKIIISLGYSGVINDDISTGAAEYARGFSETSGIIAEKGIYLAGSTQWIPKFRNAEMISFVLDVTLDQEWSIVSQGTRTLNEIKEGKKFIRYESPEPMDEIYLIGGKWTEYSIPSEKVLFQAFLRTPDKQLANKYLNATQGYLSMYEKMIGPYPFTKFALVENFWETGYGMPSFTLLGPKVIRFPWILYSSYPHELLHNYWGNSVYVDYKTGNWCEGITAYMADHLLKEQQGQGAEYRQATLQKYTDFVNPDNDFPLSEFLSRNNPAEESIGYGKCLMMNNMLRTKFGDEVFLKSYSKFYEDFKFKKAGFSDIKACFEELSGTGLDWFFDQWVARSGAPSLELSNVDVVNTGSLFDLSFRIRQTQENETFILDIPVYVYLEGDSVVHSASVNMTMLLQDYSFKFKKRPVRIEVDPVFQLFRKLDRNEVPTTLTQLFGAKNATVILPSSSPHLDEYEKMAGIWKASQEVQSKVLNIKYDNEFTKLPSDITLWIFGFDNKFAVDADIPQAYMNELAEDQRVLVETLKQEGSMVYAVRNPGNENYTLGFVGTYNSEAIEGLGRKLPHYGKYSYLGFEGTEPENKLKGVFPALGSPLNYQIQYKGKIIPGMAKIKPRKALSE